MLVNIGGGCFINKRDIEVVVPPESAPIKRLVSANIDAGKCVDLTYGKRTRSVIIMKTGRIYLAPIQPASVVAKITKDLSE